MIEPEVAFTDLGENAALAEALLGYTSQLYRPMTRDMEIIRSLVGASFEYAKLRP